MSEMSTKRQRDAQDFEIVGLLKLSNRELSLDELLIGLYRKYGVVHKREYLRYKLNRLTKLGEVINIGRGVYNLEDRDSGPIPTI